MNESFNLRLTNHRNLATLIQMHRRKFIKQVIELSSTSKISPEGRIPYKKRREVIKKIELKIIQHLNLKSFERGAIKKADFYWSAR